LGRVPEWKNADVMESLFLAADEYHVDAPKSLCEDLSPMKNPFFIKGIHILYSMEERIGWFAVLICFKLKCWHSFKYLYRSKCKKSDCAAYEYSITQ
jgi:hypothetical protein